MDKSTKAWVKFRKAEAEKELQLARVYRTAKSLLPAWAHARHPR